MNTPGPSSVYRLHPDVAIEDFDDRSLALHCSKLQLVELNTTARDVIRQLDGQASLAEVARAMVERYDVALDTILEDIQTIVAEMQNLDLVELLIQDKGEDP